MLYGGDVGPNDHIAKPPVNRATRTSSGVGWIPPELEWYLTGTAENIRNIATLGWSDQFGLTNTKKYNYDAKGSWTLFYWQSICFTVAREAPLLAFTMSTRAALLGGQGFWRASPYARTLWTTLGPRNLQLLLRAEMGVHALNAGYHGLQVVGNVRDVYNNPTNPEAWLNLGVNSGITILNAFGAKAAYGTRLNGWNVAPRGEGFNLALGLSGHPSHGGRRGLLQRFAGKVDGKDYFQLIDEFGLPNGALGRQLEEQLLDFMKNSKHIHLNLDGMIDKIDTTKLKVILKLVEQGTRVPQNITRWEFLQVWSKFRDKATFYFDGKAIDLTELLK
jgi:hypothetical protein